MRSLVNQDSPSKSPPPFLNFLKDSFFISSSSGFLAVLAVIQAFWIPTILSLREFGLWKIFTLYGSYLSLLHLGFLDGLLLRWAGQSEGKIGSEKWMFFRKLLIQQTLVLLPLGILFGAIFSGSPFYWVVMFLLILAVVFNSTQFFRVIFESSKRFRTLSWAQIVGRSLFIGCLFIIPSAFLTQAKVIAIIMIGAFSVQFLIMVSWSRSSQRVDMDIKKDPHATWTNLTKQGITILLVGLALPFVIALDQFLLSVSVPVEKFSVYSFACGTLVPVLIMIQPISHVMFPHLRSASEEEQKRVLELSRRGTGLFLGLFFCLYYLLTPLIHFLLPRYTMSLPLIRILVGSVGLLIVIQVLHFTYYKLVGRQHTFFILLAGAMITMGIAIQSVIRTSGSLRGVACVVLLGSVVLYVLSDRLLIGPLLKEERVRNWFYTLKPLLCLGFFWFLSILGFSFLKELFIYVILLGILFWWDYRTLKNSRPRLI
ncbi:hypothetical protein BVX98_01365 [bacterium F11]|nr:hypothetical protein BVX98_01365 [bacterium F11]